MEAQTSLTGKILFREIKGFWRGGGGVHPEFKNKLIKHHLKKQKHQKMSVLHLLVQIELLKHRGREVNRPKKTGASS